MKNRKQINFLELVPKKTTRYNWNIKDDGLVQIIIPRNSLLENTVRLLFKTPKSMKIDLDAVGSFVWNSIDDKRNFEEIAVLLKNQFGQSIEPLYQRLGTYINILKNNKFITIDKAGN